MPIIKFVDIKDLSLDLQNYRTTPQKNEIEAIHRMLSIRSENFIAVMESILDEGYLLRENLIVLNDGLHLIVKEGNRRLACMKIIFGQLSPEQFSFSYDLKERINDLSDEWKELNRKIPCQIFSVDERDKVDREINLTHGKGEKASRDDWSSVARARHNRDHNKAQEPALDILEKYLIHGDNDNTFQKERWSGDYPLTVLHEAIRLLSERIGYSTITSLVEVYPKIKLKKSLDKIITAIGNKEFGFPQMRKKPDFATPFGIPELVPPITPTSPSGTSTPVMTASPSFLISPQTPATPTNPVNLVSPTTNRASLEVTSATKAYAVGDPRSVAQHLKSFVPRGLNREKVVTINNEIKKLKIPDHPIAFCFLLRSMFEISAQAYCNDHSIDLYKKPKPNKDPVSKSLKELLSEIQIHLTKGSTDRAFVQALHGAGTEITKPSGLLSVTSMNQLVHNKSFIISPSDISMLFSNIFPLLKAMN